MWRRARTRAGLIRLIAACVLNLSGCIDPNAPSLLAKVNLSANQTEPSPIPSIAIPLPSITATPTPKLLPPATLTYGSNPATYKLGTAITPNAPVTTGGVPTAFSVTPALPGGISLNPATGIISGTPTVISATANYIVKATNAAGSAQVSLGIEIAENIVAPANLTYAGSPASFTRTVAITALAPTSQGGAPTSYSIAPPLPAGLTLNTTTGVISGSPTATQAATNYQITGKNTAGATTATLSIEVKELGPATISYGLNPAKYVKGTQIVPNAPKTTGGAPTSYKISGPLPAGLAFNTTTGIISGTPTQVLVMTPFNITAINSGGSAVVTVAITVNDIAPATLAYSSPKIVYTKDTAIGANLALSTGGAITSFTVTPALPAGLSMNLTSGTITGTPTVALLPILFKVTGLNTGGSIITQINLGIADLNDPNANYNYIASKIITPKCLNCHAGAGTYAGLKVYVVDGDPLASSLYFRTAQGSANPMPPGTTGLPTAESFAILNWIAMGAPPAAAAPSPTPTPTAVNGTLMVSVDEHVRLGNRRYIASVLNDVFGPSAAVTVSDVILAPGSIETLGSPCNAYSEYVAPKSNSLGLPSECSTISSTMTSPLPIGITARGALVNRACDLIASQDAAVLNAASLALGSTISASALPAMNASSVASAYDLFYLGRPIPAEVASSLLAVANSGADPMDSWRFTLVTLCYAPDWQIP